MPELRGFFTHGIFDECHRLGNRKTKQTRFAKLLQIPFLTDMSGSPATTNPENLWSILNHLKPRTYSSYWKFYERYINYIQIPPANYRKSLGPAQAWFDEGLPDIQDFYVRRLKSEVMAYLPPKLYGRIYVDLSDAQRRQYDDMKHKMIAWLDTQDGEKPLPAPAVIAQLQRLQMFALGTATLNDAGKVILTDPSTKVDAVMELLEDNPDEQFVIFTQFKGPLRLLRRRLSEHKTGGKSTPIPWGSFTGDDHPRMRALHKREFIDGTRRVLLGTIASGGVGVDGLQHASCNVIFLDRAWSPAINSQAEDRLHRGGQTRSVNIVDVLARDTVDFQRLDKIELKRKWLKEMLGDD
jgi:SNF2 family DNA or RNA helicase